jgi:hypothetical protein
MRALRPLLAAGLIALVSVSVAGGASTSARYLVPTPGQGFGPFKGGTANDLRSAFGKPSSEAPAMFRSCELKYRRLGIRGIFVTYGQHVPNGACHGGYFYLATLVGSHWHMSKGLRVGSSAAAAKRQSVGRCASARYSCDDGFTRASRPGRVAYVLSTHSSDCAGKRVPSVVAEIASGRVSAFVVYTHGCE